MASALHTVPISAATTAQRFAQVAAQLTRLAAMAPLGVAGAGDHGTGQEHTCASAQGRPSHGGRASRQRMSSVMWFRRDRRLGDNPAPLSAVAGAGP
jgi:hypothetical protein